MGFEIVFIYGFKVRYDMENIELLSKKKAKDILYDFCIYLSCAAIVFRSNSCNLWITI